MTQIPNDHNGVLNLAQIRLFTWVRMHDLGSVYVFFPQIIHIKEANAKGKSVKNVKSAHQWSRCRMIQQKLPQVFCFPAYYRLFILLFHVREVLGSSGIHVYICTGLLPQFNTLLPSIIKCCRIKRGFCSYTVLWFRVCLCYELLTAELNLDFLPRSHY